jgi:hypothetical protein
MAAQSGPYYWAGAIAHFSAYGIYGALQVTDPAVPVCPYPCAPSTEPHYASRLMSRTLQTDPEIEIG